MVWECGGGWEEWLDEVNMLSSMLVKMIKFVCLFFAGHWE